jgi:hypothetical protein
MMQLSYSRPFVLLAIASLSLLTGSCTNQKLVDCKNLLDVANQAISQSQSAQALKPEETLKQLKEIQTSLVQLYNEEGKALKDAAQGAIAAAKVAGQANQTSIDAFKKSADLYTKVSEVYNKQFTVLSEIGTYCAQQN